MAYVKRNSIGVITAISQELQEDFESIASDDPQLLQFLAGLGNEASELAASDLAFVRVVEDVIELLIDKNVIRFTDLPEQAQGKMLTRQRLRHALQPNLGLIGDEEEEGLF